MLEMGQGTPAGTRHEDCPDILLVKLLLRYNQRKSEQDLDLSIIMPGIRISDFR